MCGNNVWCLVKVMCYYTDYYIIWCCLQSFTKLHMRQNYISDSSNEMCDKTQHVC